MSESSLEPTTVYFLEVIQLKALDSCESGYNLCLVRACC